MCALRGNGNKQKKKLRLPGNNDSFQPLHLMRAPAARQNTPAAACYLTKKNPSVILYCGDHSEKKSRVGDYLAVSPLTVRSCSKMEDLPGS